jgi:TPR repeat protein
MPRLSALAVRQAQPSSRPYKLYDEREAALTAMNEEPSEVWRMIGLAMAYYATRHVHAADQEVASLIEKYGMDAAYNIAYVYAFRNQRDEAFAWLEKAAEHNDPGFSNIGIHSLFANLHGDRRWLPFLESIGMSPETLDEIVFDVKLPDQASNQYEG